MQAAEDLRQGKDKILAELRKVIVGQNNVVEEVLLSILSKGHCLLVGVPGLAKTLLVKSIASTLDLNYSRIQFTPDLMPSDITGTRVIEEDHTTGRREFVFVKGPLFANIVLADEINRTPPKTQAALLEAMQELHITSGVEQFVLEPPFFVLATQNPIEQEGTYPLPEAQLDRFMFNIMVDYPEDHEEVEIYRRTTVLAEEHVNPVIDGPTILKLQAIVRQVPVSDYLLSYVQNLVRATRPGREDAPDFVKEYISWGAGPRAGQYLIVGAKARALTHGRLNVSPEDVSAIAHPVMRHRIGLNFNAEAEGIGTDEIINRLLETVRPPEAASA
ncbi:MAG: MoxR family ATPase [Planctomycetota bacterium]|nr:MoxR family ATPase [Planctomycetota bacterium]MDA1141562.1 MoxR family ATPase [Planctomycetota bacterium]